MTAFFVKLAVKNSEKKLTYLGTHHRCNGRFFIVTWKKADCLERTISAVQINSKWAAHRIGFMKNPNPNIFYEFSNIRDFKR